MCSVKMRQMVEREIAKSAIMELINAGFTLNVYDSEEVVLKSPSRDVDEVFNAMFSTDDDQLLVFPVGSTEHCGWIHFVYGNCGYDVMSDYTTNLEEHLQKTFKLAESYE